MERVMGIEPTQPAWKAGTLPLSYTRTNHSGGGSRIRTYVRIRGQIYSLLPLTTRPSLRKNKIKGKIVIAPNSYSTLLIRNRGFEGKCQ